MKNRKNINKKLIMDLNPEMVRKFRKFEEKYGLKRPDIVRMIITERHRQEFRK